MADSWIPHMPDFCPICGHRRPAPVGTDSQGIPSTVHHCQRCEHTFRVQVLVDLEE